MSQLLSSLSNVVISMALARGAGTAGLGAFTVVFAVSMLALSFQRALISEPLHASRRLVGSGRVEDSRMLGAALLYSAACAGIAFSFGVVLDARVELIALAAVLPVAGLHDAIRYIALRRDRSGVAVLVDGTWVLVSIGLWPVVSNGTAPIAVLSWGAGAAVGLAVGTMALRVLPSGPRSSLQWWREDAREFGSKLAVATLFYTLTDQLALITIAIFVTDAALGELRAGQIVAQPAVMMAAAIVMFAVPRLASWPRERLYGRTPLAGSAAAGGAAAALLLAALIFLRPITELLFGASMVLALSVAGPLAIRALSSAAVAGVSVALRADRQGDAFVRARAISGVIGLAAIIAGVLLDGVRGAAWGMAFQGVLYMVAITGEWVRLRTRTPRKGE